MAVPRPGRRRGPRSALRWRVTTWVRRYLLYSQSFVLLVLSLVAVILGLLNVYASRTVFSFAMLSLVVLAGGFLLGVRSLLLLFVVVGAVAVGEWSSGARAVGPPVVVSVTAAIVLSFARSRGRLGVQGTHADSMLVDLRDRLIAQGEMPPLSEGWSAEVALRSAGGASFSGDFLVSSRSTDGSCLEVALVDVSGKGVDAGTRALLLSGAFGGLLGSLPTDDFLPGANQYLIRQQWDEGFATVALVELDMATGEYVLWTAGHPPAVHYDAGSGYWRVSEGSEGPVLGVIPDAKFVSEQGRLDPGDALLMFTDGLIETPGKDLSVGIDKLLGEAERLVTQGFRHGARKLIDRGAATHNDDRAVFLLWRD